MRIPTSQYSTSLISHLQTLTAKQASLQAQVSTGQRFDKLSDDPAAGARLLKVQQDKLRLQQWSSNNQRALNLSQASYSALQSVKKLSDRASEVAILGSGVGGADAGTAYGAEADGLLEQALQAANTTYAGESLFGATQTDAAPFVATRDAAGKITGVSYTGTANAAEFRISDQTTISARNSGAENQKLADFMNHLVSLRDGLQSGNAATVQTAQTGLSTSEDDMLATLSETGARQTRLEANADLQTASFSQFDQLVGQDLEVDLPQTVVKLTQAQATYQAALQSGAKLLQQSLMDYLQ